MWSTGSPHSGIFDLSWRPLRQPMSSATAHLPGATAEWNFCRLRVDNGLDTVANLRPVRDSQDALYTNFR